VAASDKQYSEELNVRIRYSQEIAENLRPEAGLAMPVLSPKEIRDDQKWRINRVFGFLTIISGMSMGALALSPQHTVQAGVLCIWTSSVAMGRYLLKRAYSSTEDTPPT